MTVPSTRLTLVPPTGMKGDLLKALYAVMLTELPRGAVREFWTGHPFRATTRLIRPADFLEFLWKGLLCIPPDYFWPVVRDLEHCARDHGLDPERFFHLANHGPQGGPPVDPAWAGELLFPSPSPGRRIEDPRDWVLQRLEVFLSSLLVGCRVQRVPEPGWENPHAVLFAFLPPPEVPGLPDFSLFPGKLVAAVPRLFGWQAFDRLELLADMRSPAALLESGERKGAGDRGDREGAGDGGLRGLSAPARRGPANVEAYGRIEPFAAALERLVGGEVAALFPGASLAAPVLVPRKDWLSADGKLRLLRRGRAYGAPCALLRVGYVPRVKWRRLASLLLDPEPRRPQPAQGGASAAMLDALHREFLDEWEKSRINH